MLKAIFTALTGISEDIDSDDSQSSWENRRYIDENDLDNYDDDYQDDSEEEEEPKTGWFGLW